MANCLSQILLIPLLITGLFLYTNAQTEINPSLNIAIQDMQKARYFTFAMLVKMVRNKIAPNTTFFMPNDHMLSTAVIPENQVLDFILLHTIPSPMLYKDLINLPNGTILPSSQRNYLFKTVHRDNGKLYINNAEVVAQDICNNEGLFRCHGISTVFRRPIRKKVPAGTPCHPPHIMAPPPIPGALAPAPMPTMPPTGMISPAPSPEIAIDGGPQISASSDVQLRRLFVFVLGSLLLLFSTVI
jgi:hypothetical protein